MSLLHVPNSTGSKHIGKTSVTKYYLLLIVQFVELHAVSLLGYFKLLDQLSWNMEIFKTVFCESQTSDLRNK
jgi:hypothetical protein